jgi:hypothetical protein
MTDEVRMKRVILRPPPGVRFSLWDADVELQYVGDREREIVTWLHAWIDAYLEPGARACDVRMGESVERESAAAERERLRRAVEGLPFSLGKSETKVSLDSDELVVSSRT